MMMRAFAREKRANVSSARRSAFSLFRGRRHFPEQSRKEPVLHGKNGLFEVLLPPRSGQ